MRLWRLCPLNITGYGEIIGASIEGTQLFYNKIKENSILDINGTKIKLEALVKPDFNMVDFAFNIEGNTGMEKMNKMNKELYDMSSYVTGTVLRKDFITSNTDFAYDDYKDAPFILAKRLGIPKEEWKKAHKLRVMRACVLTPYFVIDKVAGEYWNNYIDSMKKMLEEIVPKYL